MLNTHHRIVHLTDHTTVVAVDNPDPNAGGACHAYHVLSKHGSILASIHFQYGPIGEVGVNGVQHADLLAIIRDRLDHFQRGSFASPTNEVTCGFVSAALASEETRTRRRALAGVEGTSQKAAGVETGAAA